MPDWLLTPGRLGDGLIAVSFCTLPAAFLYFAWKRRDVDFRWMFFIFSALVFLCGGAHLASVLAFWAPAEAMEGTLKLLTGVFAIVASALLWSMIPRALTLPSPARLESANRELRRQIVERHRAEEKFRGLLESAPDAIVIANPAGDIVLVNARAEELFGYRRDELLGRPTFDLLPERSRDAHAQECRALLQDPRTERVHADLEIDALRKNGTEFPVEIALSPIHTEEGVLLASAIRDVTERRRESEQISQLAAIVTHAEDAMYSTDTDGTIRSWNRAAELIYGYAAHEVIGRSGSLLVSAERGSEPRQMIDRILRGERVIRCETSQIRKGGEQVEVALTVSPIKDSTGAVTAASVVARDITEEKRAREEIRRLNEELERRVRERTDELVRSNEELRQFAYVASHDLQEPLRTVSSFANLLSERYRGRMGPDADEFIGFIVEGIERMHDLINALLELSRLETRPGTLELTDVEAALDEALDNLRATIQDSGARVSRGSLPEVTAARPQIVQLFQNLLGNAIKFRGPREPEIHVGATESGEDWTFEVRDNGIGIEPSHADRIFSIFQRLHTREEYPGTGIGLAICRKIVENHGGRIWVESEPDSGSAFRFSLPRREQGAERG